MDIQVYALTIDRELKEEERCYLTEVMPFSRRQRMLRLREQKQSQPLCAYGLLRLALQRLHGFDQIPSIAIAPAGKPYLSEEGKIYFNISHTDGAVLCAVHDREVGVDIERSRAPAPTILHYYQISEERQFWAMWVHREAVAKCRGCGFAAMAHWDEEMERSITTHPLSIFDGFYAALATGEAKAGYDVHVVTIDELLTEMEER